MKRWISIALAALLLAGCSAQPQPQPTETAGPSTAPTSPTQGEILSYLPLAGTYEALAPLGPWLLLFRSDGADLIDPETGAVLASFDGALPLPDSGLLRVLDTGVVYFEAATGALVTLDATLTETDRRVLQEPMLGLPALSEDGTGLYFCTAAGIRHWDTKTNIVRDLRLHAGDWQGITAMTREGIWLKAELLEADGTLRQLLISTENGQTLAEGPLVPAITASGQLYCCPTESEWIFGILGQQPQLLTVPEAMGLPALGCALTVTSTPEGLVLELYDLTAGRRIAQTLFEGIDSAWGFLVQADSLLFLAGERLYRWNWALSPVTDDTQYTVYRYTADDPDTAGLAALQARADAMGQQYGVEIALWNQVTAWAPAGISFQTEWRTERLTAALDTLEAAMARFPAGFLAQAAAWTDSGTLRILLTAGIETSHQGAYSQVTRMQYTLGKDAFIALSVDGPLEGDFYHTLAHVLDTSLLSGSSHLYEWHLVNPSGFQYDGDYEKNLYRTENRYPAYFIDSFSMSFPVEDRATVFEYAMLEGNGEFFQQKYLQRKLERICKALRQVFDLEEDSYPWEQYRTS